MKLKAKTEGEGFFCEDGKTESQRRKKARWEEKRIIVKKIESSAARVKK